MTLGFRELWAFRDLLYFLTWRDIKVRYKQTALGAAWAVLQPFLTMVVFSVVFGYLARMPSDGVPYPIFAYCALVPWQMFVQSFVQSAHSLVSNQQLVTKVYFPRLIIPLASALTSVVDFVVAFVVLLGMMIYYRIGLTPRVLAIPAFALLALASALALGLWLCALNVRYRDVRYTIPFMTQVLLFVTPVAYPASLVPDKWRVLYGLNPMAGVVEGFRWSLLGGVGAPGPELLASVVVVSILLVWGLVQFRRMEATFADLI